MIIYNDTINVPLVDSNTTQLVEEEIAKLDTSLGVGDLNRDGKIDYEDLKVLRDYVKGDSELTEEQHENADVNQDGVVNENDYYFLYYGISERDKVEDRIMELESLYVTLIGGKQSASAVLGVDNSSIDAVKAELDMAKAYLAVLNSLI